MPSAHLTGNFRRGLRGLMLQKLWYQFWLAVDWQFKFKIRKLFTCNGKVIWKYLALFYLARTGTLSLLAGQQLSEREGCWIIGSLPVLQG